MPHFPRLLGSHRAWARALVVRWSGRWASMVAPAARASHAGWLPSAGYKAGYKGQSRYIDYWLVVRHAQPVGGLVAPKHKAHRRPVTLPACRSGSFVPHVPRLLGSHRAWARALVVRGSGRWASMVAPAARSSHAGSAPLGRFPMLCRSRASAALIRVASRLSPLRGSLQLSISFLSIRCQQSCQARPQTCSPSASVRWCSLWRSSIRRPVAAPSGVGVARAATRLQRQYFSRVATPAGALLVF